MDLPCEFKSIIVCSYRHMNNICIYVYAYMHLLNISLVSGVYRMLYFVVTLCKLR